MNLIFKNLKPEARGLKSGVQTPRSGIALVITLILVSVIAFMAVTFLFVSQRERGSVSVAANQTDARLAADTALQRATAQLLAPMLAFSNLFNYDLMVSTNYINPRGFDTGSSSNSYTNVNYDYTTSGTALTSGQQLQNLANLLYDPRPPVFVANPSGGAADFRYYLDLNRNGRYDTNGYLPELVGSGVTNGVTNFYVGDPEWIGILQRPELPHSSSNFFIARYAYLVLPSGKELDMNFIHNQAKRLGAGVDGFLRNQGVGSYENNLAAFFVDLNTNAWLPPLGTPFNYDTGSFSSSGSAFDDALSFLRHRYNNNFGNLAGIATAATNATTDFYAYGPLMLGTTPSGNYSYFNNGYPGADNPVHYFTHQELFDPAKTSTQFTNRLLTAGSQTNSYDRYTFYRLLSQLGTDSAPDPDRLNLNWMNMDNFGNVVPGAQTNYADWQPLRFFTNVADRLLRAAYSNAITITNIPLYPTNDYTPNVHRLLQLAANLYDATTNNAHINPTNAFPSVFRPIFGRLNTNVWIAGYTNVNDANDLLSTNNIRDVNDADPSSPTYILNVNPLDNVYGVPVVIGARKGFPNFNEFSMQHSMQVTRKLEFYDPTPGVSNRNTVSATNQLYSIIVSNAFGIEAWNPYTNNYPRALSIVAVVDLKVAMTNYGLVWQTNYALGVQTNIPANTWQASPVKLPTGNDASFKIPLVTNVLLLQTQYVRLQPGSVSPAGFLSQFGKYSTIPGSQPFPGLTITNSLRARVRFIMYDTSMTPNRIVDYVSLSSSDAPTDVANRLADGSTNTIPAPPGIGTVAGVPVNPGALWVDPTTSEFSGIRDQILVCRGDYTDSTEFDPNLSTNKFRMDEFRYRMRLPLKFGTQPSQLHRTNAFNAPFQPTRTVYHHISWQANDPLVHYTISDLQKVDAVDLTGETPPLAATGYGSLGQVNEQRYRPWFLGDQGPTDLSKKDPLATRPDDWDFPAGKLPNLGWIGRVHRGTPWQTVYLKSAVVDINEWVKWTGDQLTSVNIGALPYNDAQLSMPTNDWALLDLFSTVPNDNAARGQLPVNQTGLAAWSAALSGVLVLTNTIPDYVLSGLAPTDPRTNGWLVIQPAGISGGASSPVQTIVDAINGVRATNFNGSFKHLADMLAVPQLTVNSPFLNTSAVQVSSGISDEAYERLPQQIMSLVKLGEQPRFVIYAYGQSLKPADQSIVPFGGGLCTNYQITAETAVRAVVRVDGVINGATTNVPAALASPVGQLRPVVESYNLMPPD